MRVLIVNQKVGLSGWKKFLEISDKDENVDPSIYVSNYLRLFYIFIRLLCDCKDLLTFLTYSSYYDDPGFKVCELFIRNFHCYFLRLSFTLDRTRKSLMDF